MYFNPNKLVNNEETDDNILSINGIMISRVKEVKFLGVIIDDRLSWIPHIKKLTVKLKRECGRLHSVKRNVPRSHHNMLYRTLFESHLSYGISVWGVVSQATLEPVFTVQKKCMRIMFGDNEAYFDKFRTCARSRPYDSQILGSEFYRLEAVEPLFEKEKVLSIFSLYAYYTILEMYKIIKLRDPYAMYSLFNRSSRRDDIFITPSPSHTFIYKSAHLWNTCRKASNRIDFTVPISSIKSKLKKAFQSCQKESGLSIHNFNF